MNIEYAYRKYCTRRFDLPSEAQLIELENRLCIGFPDDYRHFLLNFNGGYFSEPQIDPVVEGCPLDALTCLHGIGASDLDGELARRSRLRLFDDNDPPRIVPIGHTAMGGLIVLATRPQDPGTIYLKQALGDFYYLADGIEEFFELLHDPPNAL